MNVVLRWFGFGIALLWFLAITELWSILFIIGLFISFILGGILLAIAPNKTIGLVVIVIALVSWNVYSFTSGEPILLVDNPESTDYQLKMRIFNSLAILISSLWCCKYDGESNRERTQSN